MPCALACFAAARVECAVHWSAAPRTRRFHVSRAAATDASCFATPRSTLSLQPITRNGRKLHACAIEFETTTRLFCDHNRSSA